MRGSVVKRGSKYSVKIELDPDPLTGQRRQKWHSGYATKREAEKARIDLLSRFDRGEYVEPTHQNMAQYLEEWIVAISPTIRPSTVDSYRRNIRLHVVPLLGSVRIDKVDGGVLNGLYATLLSRGRRPSSRKGAGYSLKVVNRAVVLRRQGLSLQRTAERLREELPEAEHITKDTLASLLRRASAVPVDGAAGLSPRTVAYIHAMLHRAFRDAVRWGRLVRNPADAADPPRGLGRGEINAWDAPTLRAFLEAARAEDDRYYPLWVLLATTGMRRGEALGLRWSDLDLDAGRARVVQTVIQIGNAVSLSTPKTSRGRRPVALDPSTVAVLRAHRQRALEDRLLVGSDFVDQGLVFHHPDGSWFRPDAISVVFLRRVGHHGLPRLTLHGLRHTWATIALEQGIHPRVVQERLGHSTIAITLEIYSHVSPTLHDEAAEQVAALIL